MTVTLEAKGFIMLKLEQLIGSLITHEMITPIDDKKKKQDLALKISTTSDNCDDDEDEEIVFLSRKFERFLNRKKEGTLKTSKSYINDGVKCYKCQSSAT